jgi:SSS family solute:Na+ symporter
VWIFATVNDDYFRSSFHQAMWMGIVAAAVDLWVTVGVSLRTVPKPAHELVGLVKGLEVRDASDTAEIVWYRTPQALGISAIALAMSMYLVFAIW